MARDPAYVRAFKDLTKSPPKPEDVEAIDQEFYGDSDRAVGLLHAGWAETAVESAIKVVLKPDFSKDVFDYEGPLGTFSAKIRMAYALGLFGENTKHDLLLIRTLRNGFAHCSLPLQFETPEVRDLCDHLILPDSRERVTPTYFLRLPDTKPDYWFDEKHPKTRFVTGCNTIIVKLLNYYWHFKEAPIQGTGLP